MPDSLDIAAAEVVAAFKAAGKMAAVAESCTGGMVAAALTAIPGASAMFDRGFVTYSNAAKSDLLGIDPDLIDEHGAVSAEVAAAMAWGALFRSRAKVAVSITGIAGPAGGTAEKPVGLVWFGLSTLNGTTAERLVFSGDRDAIRRQAAEKALALLLQGVFSLSSG